jgi:hypothetical protein
LDKVETEDVLQNVSQHILSKNFEEAKGLLKKKSPENAHGLIDAFLEGLRKQGGFVKGA